MSSYFDMPLRPVPLNHKVPFPWNDVSISSKMWLSTVPLNWFLVLEMEGY